MKTNRGIVKTLILIILAIAALVYFRIDLRAWVEKVIAWWQGQDLAWLSAQWEFLVDKITKIF